MSVNNALLDRTFILNSRGRFVPPFLLNKVHFQFVRAERQLVIPYRDVAEVVLATLIVANHTGYFYRRERGTAVAYEPDYW